MTSYSSKTIGLLLFLVLVAWLPEASANSGILSNCLHDFQNDGITERSLTGWLLRRANVGIEYSYSFHGKSFLYRDPSFAGDLSKLFYDRKQINITKENSDQLYAWVSPATGRVFHFGECAIIYGQSTSAALALDSGLQPGAPIVIDLRSLKGETIEDRGSIHWSITGEFGPLLKSGDQLILSGMESYRSGKPSPLRYYSFDSTGHESAVKGATPADDSILEIFNRDSGYYCDEDTYFSNSLSLYHVEVNSGKISTKLVSDHFSSFNQCDLNHGLVYTSGHLNWQNLVIEDATYSFHPGIKEQGLFERGDRGYGPPPGLATHGELYSNPSRLTQLGQGWYHEFSINPYRDESNEHVLYLTDSNGTLIGQPLLTHSPAFVFKNKIVSVNICFQNTDELNDPHCPYEQFQDYWLQSRMSPQTADYVLQITSYDTSLKQVGQKYVVVPHTIAESYGLFRIQFGNSFDFQSKDETGVNGPVSTKNTGLTDEGRYPTFLDPFLNPSLP